jgi:hypothetical protein
MSRLAHETDKSTVLRMIQTHGPRCDCILKYAPLFANDRDIVQASIEIDPRSIYHASSDLKKDVDLALYVVGKNGLYLSYVDISLLQHREVVITAIRQNWKALYYLHHSMLEDPEIMSIATEHGVTKNEMYFA